MSDFTRRARVTALSAIPTEPPKPSTPEPEPMSEGTERRGPGRPKLEEETFPVTVMLTATQITTVDVALAKFNSKLIRKRTPKVKRNHVIQAFLDALTEVGYELASREDLDDLKADLRRRLTP